jgi:hypothetical protein
MTNIYNYTINALDFSNEIVVKEQERINAITDNVDIAYNTFERKQHFRESDVKKRKAWSYLYFISLVGLLIICFVILIRSLLNAWFIDLLLIMVLSGFLFYLTYLYIKIEGRSPLNFDKINTTDNSSLSLSSSSVATTKYGIVEKKQACVGEECCPNKFDKTLNLCQSVGGLLQENAYESFDNLNNVSSKYL